MNPDVVERLVVVLLVGVIAAIAITIVFACFEDGE